MPFTMPSVAGDATEDTVPERRTIADADGGGGAVALPGTMAESRGAEVPAGTASSAPSPDRASDGSSGPGSSSTHRPSTGRRARLGPAVRASTDTVRRRRRARAT